MDNANLNTNLTSIHSNRIPAAEMQKANSQAVKSKTEAVGNIFTEIHGTGKGDQSLKPPGAPAENSPYIDENRLLRATPGDGLIKPYHRDWFLNQALLLSHSQHANPASKSRVELVALHGYSKAATVAEKHAKNLGIQMSPFLHDDNRYHRSTSNYILDKVRENFARETGVLDYELRIVDGVLFREVMAREMPQEDFPSLSLRNKEEYLKIVDQLFSMAKAGKFPENRIVIDMSKYLAERGGGGKEAKKIAQEFEQAFVNKLEAFLKAEPGIDRKALADKLVARMQLIAFDTHKGYDVLFMPGFLLEAKEGYSEECNRILGSALVGSHHGVFDKELNAMMIHSGYRLSPDKAKEALLKTQSYESLLTEQRLPKPELATKGKSIPKVLENCSQIPRLVIAKQFESLAGQEKAPPYLRLYPVATLNLLKGLGQIQQETGGLDRIFAQKGMTDVLQTSYFRILNSMHEAILRKDQPIAFYNQIELIHQEIQNILAIAQPYDKEAVSVSVSRRLTEGSNPISPSNIEPPKVHLKASAMRGLSSILAGVEAQNGKPLSIAVMKDSYYEAADALTHAKQHQVSTFDGDIFNRLGETGVKQAFSEGVPKKKIDLFLCEYHHNISLKRQSYSPEKVLGQIKAMGKQGLLNTPCTVVIDSTINLEQAPEFRELLNDKSINKWIREGKLNIVFLRSAQKFDMLGIDNYYGGFTIAFNNSEAFPGFNERMKAPEEDLGGISNQGMTHLQKHAPNEIEAYRAAIMKNNQLLYSKLPKKSIYKEGMNTPMQISSINDDQLVFIDIKFPNLPKTGAAFRTLLLKYTKNQKIPMTTRASFGFATTNFTVIDEHKFRLNPGLDDEQTLNQYAHFFHKVQEFMDRVMPQAEKMPTKEMDLFLSNQLSKLVI